VDSSATGPAYLAVTHSIIPCEAEFKTTVDNIDSLSVLG